MTIPNLVTAARRYLVADTTLANALGSGQGFNVWVFQWRPYVTIEGSGEAAVVLSARGGWTSPNMHNTMAFPRLQVEVWADLQRDANGNPAQRTAEDLCQDVGEQLDRLLHLPDGQLHVWGDSNGSIRVLRSMKLGEIDIVDVPEGDGMCRGTLNYGVVLG